MDYLRPRGARGYAIWKTRPVRLFIAATLFPATTFLVAAATAASAFVGAWNYLTPSYMLLIGRHSMHIIQPSVILTIPSRLIIVKL